nr:5456_t:CDS:10 [Entrophospora candida]
MSTALQHINGCGINTTNSTYNNRKTQSLTSRFVINDNSQLPTIISQQNLVQQGLGQTTPLKTTTATSSATATASSAKAQTTVKSPTWREIKQMPGMIFSFPVIFPRSTFATIGDDSIKDDKSASSTSGTSTPSADNNTTTDVIQSTSISTDATATTNAQLTTVTAATSARSRKGRRPSTSKSTTSTSSATTKPSIANPVINLDYNPYYVEGPSATIIHRPLLLPDIVRSYAQEKRNQMRSRPITRAKNKQENHILDMLESIINPASNNLNNNSGSSNGNDSSNNSNSNRRSHRERDILSSTRRDRRSPRVVSSNPNSHRSRTNYNNSSNNNNSAIANHNIINGRRSQSRPTGDRKYVLAARRETHLVGDLAGLLTYFCRVAVAGSGANNTPGSSNNDSDDIRRCCKCQTAKRPVGKPLCRENDWKTSCRENICREMIVEEMGATLYNQWYHKYIKYLIRRLDTGTDNQKLFLPNSDDIIIVYVNIQDPEYYDSANSINALLDANDVNEYFDNFDQNVSTEEALMEEEEKIITPTALENLNKPKRFFGNDLYGLIGYVDINGNLYKLDDHKKKRFDVDDGNINNKYNINIIDIDQFWNGDENDNLQEILLPFSPSPPLNIIFKKISCGENHCLALTKQGEVYSWGDGRYGQLGHGDFRSLNKPKVIEFFQGLKVTQIACGGLHSAVITDSGDLYTFGWNNLGRLGVKSNTTNTSIPCLIEFNNDDADYDEEEEEINVLKVACGSAHTVVITDDNKLWTCGWGI